MKEKLLIIIVISLFTVTIFTLIDSAVTAKADTSCYDVTYASGVSFDTTRHCINSDTQNWLIFSMPIYQLQASSEGIPKGSVVLADASVYGIRQKKKYFIQSWIWETVDCYDNNFDGLTINARAVGSLGEAEGYGYVRDHGKWLQTNGHLTSGSGWCKHRIGSGAYA